MISRWIGSGMPVGKATDPTVASIAIYPDSRVVTRGASQQMIVTAHYHGWHLRGRDPLNQYQSNDPEVADVAEGGKVAARELSGQAGIMARYQGQVAVFSRATVPLELADRSPDRIQTRQPHR